MIRRWRLIRYDLPLARPLTTGSPQDRRQGLLVEVMDAEGRLGRGEAAPLPGLHRTSLAAVQAELLTFFQTRAQPPSAVGRFGLEGAMLDLIAERMGRRPAHVLNPAPAAEVPLNGLIDDLPGAVERARALAAAGYPAAKLKVGRADVEAEINVVRAVREAVPGLALRLDANRAWSFATARRFCLAVRSAGIEYIEEPLREAVPERLCALHQETGIALALDESLGEDALSAAEMLRSRLPDGVVAVVIKPTVIGGLAGALLLGRRARQRGLRPVISATFESGVGLRLLGEIAAALGEGLPAQGLDTRAWLAEDVLSAPLPIEAGRMLASPQGALREDAEIVEVAAGELG